MFLLKAEALGIQTASQLPVHYLGRYFSPVASFPLNARKDAEQRCVKSSELGVMSLLVEFTESLVLCCEGLPTQPEPQPEPLPVQTRTLIYRGVPIKQQTSAAEAPIVEPATVRQEMRYRGVVVKRSQAEDSSELTVHSQPPRKELAANR